MPVFQTPTGSVELYVVVSDHTNPAGNDVIFAQRYTPGGDKNGAPIQITPDNYSATPLSTLILANGDFVVEYHYSNQYETSPQFPFPPERLATQEIGFDGSTLRTNELGLNDYGTSRVYQSVALANGAYAYVLETFEGLGFGGFVDTQTLSYVTADGAISTVVLDTTSGGDGPFPRLFQTLATLAVLPDGRFTVSWTEAYTPANPNFPPDEPPPAGERTLRRVYTEAGLLTTKITVDFDGSKLVENFDPASGQETTSLLVEADGSRVATTFGIVGKSYVEQSIQTDATGHVTEQKRYYADAAHTLAFDQINRPDGTGEAHQYDTAGRETASVTLLPSGERDLLQFTYAGSSTIPHLATKITVGSDGSRFVENFDPTSGQETTSLLLKSDGSRVATTFGIVGKSYVEQSIQTDAAGHITEQKRYYAGAAHTLAFDQINRPDGTGEVHQYDTAGRETVSVAGILSGERDVLQFTYAGSSAIPSTTVLTHFGPGGVKEFVDQTKVDGSHVQTAYAAGVTLVSHEAVSDVFQGFKNGADTFAFASGFGKDVVSGFEPGSAAVHDVLSIDAGLVADYAALAGRISAVGTDTLITIDASDTILLKNVAPGALTADNFHFVPHDLLLA